jgi:hypothetical protein
MTGENLRIKIFYSETRGHVLTPFMGICLTDAKAGMAADSVGGRLADRASQPMEKDWC